MRAFIAIKLPPEIKKPLAGLEEKLAKTQADVKWVQPENIHLTLKFLGEIDEEKLDRIIQITEDTAKDTAQFNLSISGLGAFPKMNSPRVVWVGVEQGNKEAEKIAKILEDKLEKIGIPKEERAFSSHITLGRTRSSLGREKLVEAMQELGKQFGKKRLEFTVTGITLLKSTLTPAGPIYEALKETNLNAT